MMPDPDDNPLDIAPPEPVHYAEQALLGALLLQPELRQQIEDLLPEHFANPNHAALYAAMRHLTPPAPQIHAKRPVWIEATVALAATETPGLTPAYAHTLVSACPQPRHIAAYAQMIRADHARRTLREHAQRLAQTTTDTTLPDPVATTLQQTDALTQHLNRLAAHWKPHPGSPPHTRTTTASPTPVTDESAADDEQEFLGTATASPASLQDLRAWLWPDDFTIPLHGQLYQCLTDLTHRGDAVDPITVLWEAQHHGLLTTSTNPEEILHITAPLTGDPSIWGTRILQRALLAHTHATAATIITATQNRRHTPHQLITSARRALSNLTNIRTRWHRAHHATPPATHSPARGPTPAPPTRTHPALTATTHHRKRSLTRRPAAPPSTSSRAPLATQAWAARRPKRSLVGRSGGDRLQNEQSVTEEAVADQVDAAPGIPDGVDVMPG